MQTTLPAAELQAAVKKTLTSAAVSKFITESVQAALAQSACVQPGIQLAGMKRPLRFEQNSVAVLDYYSDDRACNVTIYRGHSSLGPHVYWGREWRKDLDGKLWTHSLPSFVMDDFGDLVEEAA